MASNFRIKQEKDSDDPQPGPSSASEEGLDETEVEARIMELLRQFPKGITDKIMINDMPNVSAAARAGLINKLLSQGKIDLFKVAKELVYRLSDKQASKFKGIDNEERVVMRIIEEAGNKGIWHREIRLKSNLNQQALVKVLKSLETKKLIKSVSSISAGKKKVYMLYGLEPDRSITGGSWYSGNEFESEFVDTLCASCARLLADKAAKAKEIPNAGPLMIRNASCLSSQEIWQFITDLKISKVPLNVEEIEMILDTLVYDGKIEKTMERETASGQIKTYRAITKLIPSAGFVRIPCGVCPVIRSCGTIGSVQPKDCVYYEQWVD